MQRTLPILLLASLLAGAAWAQRPGQQAPDFTLVDQDGQVVTLRDFAGKPVVLNAWATWCAFCIEEIPLFQQVHDAVNLDETRVTFLLVNLAEDFGVASSFLSEEVDTTLRSLFDPSQQQKERFADVDFDSTRNLLTRTYRVRGMPTSFFIGADGSISSVKIGPLTAGELASHLAGLGVEWSP